MIHEVLYIPGGARVLPSTVWHCGSHVLHLLEQGLGIVGWIVPPPPTCLNPNAKAHQNTVASKISGVVLLPRHLGNKAAGTIVLWLVSLLSQPGPLLDWNLSKIWRNDQPGNIWNTSAVHDHVASQKHCCWNVVFWNLGPLVRNLGGTNHPLICKTGSLKIIWKQQFGPIEYPKSDCIGGVSFADTWPCEPRKMSQTESVAQTRKNYTVNKSGNIQTSRFWIDAFSSKNDCRSAAA